MYGLVADPGGLLRLCNNNESGFKKVSSITLRFIPQDSNTRKIESCAEVTRIFLFFVY
jgi:hypothetical protein